MLGLGVGLPRRLALARAVRSATETLRQEVFGQGQQGLLFVPQPVVDGQQILFRDSAFTDPIPMGSTNEPVGGMIDLSPNGNNATQPTSADRPTYNTDGSLHWLGFDGAGDNLVTTNFSTTKTMMLAFRRVDINDLLIITTTTGTENIFTIQAGSTNPPHGQASVLEVLLDGVVVSTRDELHNATSDLAWHVAEARMADVSLWSDIKIGDYSTPAFNNPFELGTMLVFDADDAGTRREAREYIAGQYGVTL